MFVWLSANAGTVIIAAILVVIVAGIVFKLRKDKKKGVSSCGGNCAHCAMGCACHNGK
ncbi:MAG: FeoB-associated Cys-rich membrane protein [Clostridia bacterium]|nr:FeoB-associated Cys-rich membrane protein [Clostridia bacterium]